MSPNHNDTRGRRWDKTSASHRSCSPPPRPKKEKAQRNFSPDAAESRAENRGVDVNALMGKIKSMLTPGIVGSEVGKRYLTRIQTLLKENKKLTQVSLLDIAPDIAQLLNSKVKPDGKIHKLAAFEINDIVSTAIHTQSLPTTETEAKQKRPLSSVTHYQRPPIPTAPLPDLPSSSFTGDPKSETSTDPMDHSVVLTQEVWNNLSTVRGEDLGSYSLMLDILLDDLHERHSSGSVASQSAQQAMVSPEQETGDQIKEGPHAEAASVSCENPGKLERRVSNNFGAG